MKEQNFLGLSKEKKKFLTQLQTKKGRKKKNLLLGEGIRTVETALLLGARPHSLYLSEDFSPSDFLTERLGESSFPLFRVSSSEFKEIGTTITPQGILGVFERPRVTAAEILQAAPPMVLALDSLQDAGNIGTIFRTAHTLGISSVLVGKNTADPYQPKAVRSSVGTLFGLSLAPFLDLGEELQTFQQKGYRIITSVPRGGTPPEELDLSSPGVVVFGNEGAGIGGELLFQGDSSITIPQVESAESLNVTAAASIILYSLARKARLV